MNSLHFPWIPASAGMTRRGCAGQRHGRFANRPYVFWIRIIPQMAKSTRNKIWPITANPTNRSTSTTASIVTEYSGKRLLQSPHTQVPATFSRPHFRQAVTAAGMGCQAALQVQRFIEELGLGD